MQSQSRSILVQPWQISQQPANKRIFEVRSRPLMPKVRFNPWVAPTAGAGTYLGGEPCIVLGSGAIIASSGTLAICLQAEPIQLPTSLGLCADHARQKLATD